MSTSGQRKIFLRLDDGSLIGRASDLGTEPASQKVVRLSVDQAAQIGRATDKEVERLQSILIRIKAQYHVQPAALEPARSLPPIKKARVDPLPQPVPAATPGPWQSKCKEMLKAVIKNLGPNSGVFYNPVDAKLLPDYYKIVTQPLFLRDIDARLNGGQYQMPDEFHRDMKHHFDNVRLYNPKGDPFRNMGEKAEDLFETLWNTAGFNVERSRRLTAGQAAPKFEPEQFDAPAKPKPSRSQQGGASKRPRDGGQRTASHEVTSGKNGLDDTGRLLPSRIQEMGQYLSREDLPEEQSTHLLNLLPPAMLEGIQSGELELDLDAMDNETLIRIDQWLRSLPEAQAMLSPVQPQPSVRVDSYDDDEDYEEDSDESD